MKPGSKFALLAVAMFFIGCHREAMTIHFDAPPGNAVVVGIHDANGTLVRHLHRPTSEAGSIVWDGLDDARHPVRPGTFTWTAVTHRGFDMRPSGSVCFNEPIDRLPASPEPPRWGGDGGTPTAVAADETRVYLGWGGGQIVGCDLDAHVIWSVALPEGASCQALAVDGDTVVALARSRPPWVAVDHLVKLRAASGELAAWPAGQTLPVTALWPENAETKPAHATAMTARSGRIYLTFSERQFLAVLRTDTGAYLQTVVGPPPGCIDVTPTQSESPEEPGKLIEADFAVVALQGGTLGKVLFAHEPLWVMMSDLQPLDRDERITALALLGDGAKHHQHSVFVGLGAPFHQVQRRSVLASEGFLWIAGRAGGRPSRGPWQSEALGPVNAVALDARGRLWVAEGDAVPPRFSVWNTEGNQGRLEREFFGPVPREDTGAAVLPSDPEIIIGAGCEWRIAPGGGPAKCLGVITGDGMAATHFRQAENGALLLLVRHPDGTVSVFERRGEGDYEPREQHSKDEKFDFDSRSQLTIRQTGLRLVLDDVGHSTWLIRTDDGLNLVGVAPGPLGGTIVPSAISAVRENEVGSLVQAADGAVYGATAAYGLCRVKIGGLGEIRRLPGGKLTVGRKK